MTEHTISVTELARNLADVLNRVFYRRERFTLTRGGRTIARLTPPEAGITLGMLPEILADAPHLDPDDAEAFADDLDRMREEMAALPPRDPWAS